MFRRLLGIIILSILVSEISIGQGRIRGTIIDSGNDETLVGATVALKGTTKGTISAVDGSFQLNGLPTGNQTIKISYVGYQSKELEATITKGETTDMGNITLEPDAVGLNEVKVFANYAINRKTPVAVSNIQASEIQTKIGTMEFPEILKSTPGIFAHNDNGGWGEAQVYIRGFDNTNVAVMINGIPVNDMENDRVYWSNWKNLRDVTANIQVQRGLGATQVAVPSVGGTINILTETTEAEREGQVFYNYGHDNHQKYGAKFSTGLTENDWAVTFALKRTTGDAYYVEGTPYEGYSYYFSLSKIINDAHRLSFSAFGAPQWHARRYTRLSFEDMVDPEKGPKWNAEWGYKEGQFYSNSTNFYHKPFAALNHHWTLSNDLNVSTAFYGSYGNGGGGYVRDYGIDVTAQKYNKNGYTDFDMVVEDNQARTTHGLGSGAAFVSSHNNHYWFGALSNIRYKLNNINFTFGIDGRYYLGQHWQEVDDLLGGEYLHDDANVNAIYLYNNAAQKGDKVNYNNDGEVLWGGLFAQAEYSLGDLNAFASFSLSNKIYRRIDYAQYFTEDAKNRIAIDDSLREAWEYRLSEYMDRQNADNIMQTDAYNIDRTTDWYHFLGYTVKGGANYNLTAMHNVFFNTGYITRQPKFSDVFQNYDNKVINENALNEKIFSVETGYGLQSQYVSADLNFYFTLWMDKTYTGSVDAPGSDRFFYNIRGIDARHMGIELEMDIQPMSALDIKAMISLGDWIWANNVDSVDIFDESQNVVETLPKLYLDDLKVAIAPQTTAYLGVNYDIINDFTVGVDMDYRARAFADFDVFNRVSPEDAGVNTWELPDVLLFDANAYYRFDLENYRASLFANVHNLLDTEYVSTAEDALFYPGLGRRWSLGLQVTF